MKKAATILLTLGLILLSACGQSGETATNGNPSSEQTPAAVQPPEPVTLKVHFTSSFNEVFQTYVEPFIKQKLPHITLEYVTKGTWEEMIAAKDVPDIIMPNATLAQAIELGLTTNLDPFVEKNKFDLSRIDSGLIESIRGFSEKGELLATPASRGAVVLLYNKDIFDKFGVSYPKDGMTWEEVLELTKKLTRSEGGVQYRGLNPTSLRYIETQLEVKYFDENGNAKVTTEDWRKLADTWKRITEIPGNMWKNGGRAAFTTDQDTAMILTHSSFLIRTPVEGLNWDFVTGPTFENGLQANGLGTMFVISSTSKHKDAAFELLELYHSDEVQLAITKDAALLTELSDPAIYGQYGANKKDVSGLNLQANFKGTQAVTIIEKNREEVAKPIIDQYFNMIATGEKDINTALREAEERIDQEVRKLNNK